jgi:hypothetical protein
MSKNLSEHSRKITPPNLDAWNKQMYTVDVFVAIRIFSTIGVLCALADQHICEVGICVVDELVDTSEIVVGHMVQGKTRAQEEAAPKIFGISSSLGNCFCNSESKAIASSSLQNYSRAQGCPESYSWEASASRRGMWRRDMRSMLEQRPKNNCIGRSLA